MLISCVLTIITIITIIIFSFRFLVIPVWWSPIYDAKLEATETRDFPGVCWFDTKSPFCWPLWWDFSWYFSEVSYYFFFFLMGLVSLRLTQKWIARGIFQEYSVIFVIFNHSLYLDAVDILHWEEDKYFKKSLTDTEPWWSGVALQEKSLRSESLDKKETFSKIKNDAHDEKKDENSLAHHAMTECIRHFVAPIDRISPFLTCLKWTPALTGPLRSSNAPRYWDPENDNFVFH